jgi:hypothetical protein
MSTKRSRVITMAAAGTLTLAVISAAATALPSSSSPAPASANAAYTTISQQAAAHAARSAATGGLRPVALSDRMRSIQDQRQHEQEAAAAKAAPAKAAAGKAAAAKAATLKASEQAAARATPAAQPARRAAVAGPSGSPEQVAKQMLSQFGWSSSQFTCLQPLWEQESGWNLTAENPTSGAYGIPQSLPGSQMSSAGADWQTNAATQIRWGLTYIHGRYGSPCGAEAHEKADGWY